MRPDGRECQNELGARHIDAAGQKIEAWRIMKSPSGSKATDLLDRVDRQLLMALQEDARTSVAELARRVHLTPTPCQLRLQRLERDGYIESFGARINAERAGFDLLAYIAVTLERETPDLFEHFHLAVQDVEEIEECYMTAGGFDYLLKIRSRSMDDFRRFLGTRLVTLPGLQLTHTYFVMEKVKTRSRLNLRAETTVPAGRKAKAGANGR